MSFKITKPVRMVEFFSGVGTQAMSLRDLQVPFERWKTSDWDVNTTKSYKAIHHPDDNTDYSEGMNKEELIEALYSLCISVDGKNPMTKSQISRKGEGWLREVYNCFKASHNLGSITNIHAKDLEIDEENYTTILTYSHPCQDLSVAGRQAGMKKGTGTRSGLLWEVERIINECEELGCLPTILLQENVDAIHNKKNLPDLEEWIHFLESKGYKNYWQDLNAKNYGIPQNRKRFFMISILSDEPYIFPEPIPLEYRLKDFLEDSVEEKYYINNEKSEKLIQSLIDRGALPKPEETIKTISAINKSEEYEKDIEVAGTIMARDWKGAGHQSFPHVVENNGQ